jgi:hypothetical protein
LDRANKNGTDGPDFAKRTHFLEASSSSTPMAEAPASGCGTIDRGEKTATEPVVPGRVPKRSG